MELPRDYQSISIPDKTPTPQEVETCEKVLKWAAESKAVEFAPLMAIWIMQKTTNILRWFNNMRILDLQLPKDVRDLDLLCIDEPRHRLVVVRISDQHAFESSWSFTKIREATDSDRNCYPVVNVWGSSIL